MINKIIKHLEDTLLHKQYVLESAKKLCKYLIEVGRIDDAIELVKRCSNHDNSKFEPDEIFALIHIIFCVFQHKQLPPVLNYFAG